MDLRNLQLYLKKKQTKPQGLYLICGEDIYLKDEAESLIKKKLLSGTESEEKDIEIYHGSQMNYERCLDSLSTISFFSELKIVHIREAELLKTTFVEQLVSLLSKGEQEGLAVVLSLSKIDKRKKVYKSLVEASLFVEVKSPYDSQVENWIRYIADKEKVDLAADACAYLNFLVGPSLIEISKNMKKLREVFGGEKVGKAKVHEIISKNGEMDIFAICDFLAKGQLTEAVLGLEKQLQAGANGIGMLAMLFRHFRILENILLELARDKKTSAYLSKKDLAAKVGVPTFFLDNYVKQAKVWNLKKLSKVFYALEAADLSLKSTRLKDISIFSAFFVEVSKILGNQKSEGAFKEAVYGL